MIRSSVNSFCQTNRSDLMQFCLALLSPSPLCLSLSLFRFLCMILSDGYCHRVCVDHGTAGSLDRRESGRHVGMPVNLRCRATVDLLGRRIKPNCNARHRTWKLCLPVLILDADARQMNGTDCSNCARGLCASE